MSRAWMPFYVGDYLADTQHLTTLQHGMYVLLICHYWKHGGLPDTVAGRCRIVHCHTVTWRKNEAVISEFFSQPGWRHKRIDAELAKYEKVRYARRLAGSTGGTKTQVVRHLRIASAQAIASSRNQAIAQANALPTTEERKKEVADEASKLAVVQPEPSLTASPYLAAVLEKKGWVRR